MLIPPVDSHPSPTDDDDDREETSIAPMWASTIVGVMGRAKPDRNFGRIHDLGSDPRSVSILSRQNLNDSNWLFAASEVVSLARGEECPWA